MRRALVAIGVLILVVSASLASASPAVAAQGPNHSIFLYKPGTAITGTLKGGVFNKKRTFKLKGAWTHAAASRDTLALYNRSNGKLRTGTFRGGIFTARKTITVRTGYQRMIASCDSLLLYTPSSGRAMTAILAQGRTRARTETLIGGGWDLLTASCDSAFFLDTGPGLAASGWGGLASGFYVDRGTNVGLAPVAHLASTATSYLIHDAPGLANCGPVCGALGTLDGGEAFGTAVRQDLVPAAIVAGAANTVLFYRRNGTGGRATLANGTYTFVGNSANLPKGITLIAGGR